MPPAIFSKSIGSGKPILLLHGFCETHHIWDDLQGRLAEHNKVISIDLPGFGDSEHPDIPFALTEIAEMLNLWLEGQKIGEVTIIGHSLGGYIALAFAKLFPEKVKGLCLFHSSILADDVQKQQTRIKTAEFIENQGLDTYIDAFFQNLFSPSNLQSTFINTKLEIMRERAKLTSTKVVIAYLMAMKDRPDHSDWVRSYQGHLSFIAGSDDLAVPITSSRLQSTLNPGIEFHELDQVGHMGMFEDPDRSISILTEFIRKQ